MMRNIATKSLLFAEASASLINTIGIGGIPLVIDIGIDGGLVVKG